ncbi:hypothetical protein [Streptomyces sp. XY152]|uniref:hypothetical protein n=1 Tax=Streptomyces sp. XY152 TaxID=1415560 RepID=UPI0006B007A4|nr:hypothetical protein [Streptomyces sp. XY152]KOV24637.1 hypothetical protein ADK58_19635 [Streptomyces sp. XY152]
MGEAPRPDAFFPAPPPPGPAASPVPFWAAAFPAGAFFAGAFFVADASSASAFRAGASPAAAFRAGAFPVAALLAGAFFADVFFPGAPDRGRAAAVPSPGAVRAVGSSAATGAFPAVPFPADGLVAVVRGVVAPAGPPGPPAPSP